MNKKLAVWVICFCLFLANQAFERLGGRVPFLYSYFDDMLFFILILPIGLLAVRFVEKNKHRVLTYSEIASSFVALCVFFEILLPIYSHRFIADIFDPLFYLIGVIIYIFIFNKPIVPSKQS